MLPIERGNVVLPYRIHDFSNVVADLGKEAANVHTAIARLAPTYICDKCAFGLIVPENTNYAHMTT
jgi:hypothetical protein